jgi:hypothetical protein
MGPVFFCLLVSQGQASLGIGLGVVRHDEGTSFSAFTLAPAAQRLSPALFWGTTGGLSLLEGGVWAAQGRGEVWAAHSLGDSTKPSIAANAVAASSTRSDGIAAGSAVALAELIWPNVLGRRGGVATGAGGALGVIEGVPSVAALRLRVRGWWQPPRSSAQMSFTAEATRFYGAWFTDLVAGTSIDQQRIVASVWLSARVSGTYGSTGAASGTLQYFLSPRTALEFSGGSYLRDPFQGLPRAAFGSASIRLHTVARAIAAPVPPLRSPSTPLLQPLIALPRGGDTVVVRFRMDGAGAVAIAGNWNAWQPAPLQSLGDDIWEAALLLAPGTYYFNLVVDGTEWVVPGGVAVVPDGMGGLLAVLTVL